MWGLSFRRKCMKKLWGLSFRRKCMKKLWGLSFRRKCIRIHHLPKVRLIEINFWAWSAKRQYSYSAFATILWKLLALHPKLFNVKWIKWKMRKAVSASESFAPGTSVGPVRFKQNTSAISLLYKWQEIHLLKFCYENVAERTNLWILFSN